MPDRDEHYIKYRVFHEPMDEEIKSIDKVGHPVPISVSFLYEEGVTPDGTQFEDWKDMEEVEGPFYVLRPENDHHARVALAAYAYSCREEFPQLAADLIRMTEMIVWEEEVGQQATADPEEEDYEVTGEDVGSNVVQMLKNWKSK